MALTKDQIFETLRSCKIPGSKSDIVSGSLLTKVEVQEKSIFVEVTLAESNPVFEKSLQYQIEKVLHGLDAGLQIAISFAKKSEEKEKSKPQIGTILAVGSGKGGVGKSAVTVNLAVSLQNLGYSVGILDCDIYGPSIPTMLGLEGRKPMMLDGKVQPLEAFGLKVMSAGFFVEAGQGIIWRGPMIHKLIQQFFNDVNWGRLDILVIDLPPGTGDAPLSLSQTLPITGAVMVSMPSRVSLADVHKSVSMFHQVKVPVIGIVENMSHHECVSCGHVEEIFDRGGVKKFCREQNITYLGDIPIDARIRKMSDEGRPFMLDFSETPAGKALTEITARIRPFISEVENLEPLKIII